MRQTCSKARLTHAIDRTARAILGSTAWGEAFELSSGVFIVTKRYQMPRSRCERCPAYFTASKSREIGLLRRRRPRRFRPAFVTWKFAGGEGALSAVWGPLGYVRTQAGDGASLLERVDSGQATFRKDCYP